MKPFLIYGVPRTGSSILNEMIKEVLIDTEQNNFLGEYFHEEIMVMTDNPIMVQFKPELKFANLRTSYQNKFSLLKKDPAKYFFTLFLRQINYDKDIFDWLNEHYQFICIERHNLEHSCLSHSIGLHTNIWWTKNKESFEQYQLLIQNSNLNIKETDILFFKKLLNAYFEYKKMIRNLAGTVYYEDFIVRKEDILKDIGIEKPDNYIYKPSYIKQNLDYYNCIQNKEQVKEWIKNHILEEYK